MDLPNNLLRQAKITAVKRGTTLRALVGRALSRELGLPGDASGAGKRMNFPIFGSASPGSLNLTNADLAKMEAKEDARRHGLNR
ncbi:MAG: hypothetical protein HY360_19735 [Verrucomicrobia bacterium]|nr:hypothetical protein [Verrucomicrobiota bacterium]